MTGFTVENMDYNKDNSESMNRGPESLVGPQAEKELTEALQAIRAHEDAKKTVESTAKLAEKEAKEAGIPLETQDRGGLELSDTPPPLSRAALANKLQGNIFSVASRDAQVQEELKYAFIPEGDARLKNLNRNPESAKQVQLETGTVTVA